MPSVDGFMTECAQPLAEGVLTLKVPSKAVRRLEDEALGGFGPVAFRHLSDPQQACRWHPEPLSTGLIDRLQYTCDHLDRTIVAEGVEDGVLGDVGLVIWGGNHRETVAVTAWAFEVQTLRSTADIQ